MGHYAGNTALWNSVQQFPFVIIFLITSIVVEKNL